MLWVRTSRSVINVQDYTLLQCRLKLHFYWSIKQMRSRVQAPTGVPRDNEKAIISVEYK
jgi:hypothetical protein